MFLHSWKDECRVVLDASTVLLVQQGARDQKGTFLTTLGVPYMGLYFRAGTELGLTLEWPTSWNRPTPVPLQLLNSLGFLAADMFRRELADSFGDFTAFTEPCDAIRVGWHKWNDPPIHMVSLQRTGQHQSAICSNICFPKCNHCSWQHSYSNKGATWKRICFSESKAFWFPSMSKWSVTHIWFWWM